VADAYLKYLYSPAGQEIIANNYYRPRDPAVAAKYADRFPAINMATIADLGGWEKVHRAHFADGAIFDQISLVK
jgi:sulfate transport system substrate-binding protein